MAASTPLKLALAFSLSMNAAVVGAVVYRHGCRGGTCDVSAGHAPAFEELSLTSRQRESFEERRQRFLEHRQECHGRMLEMRRALVDELFAQPPDERRIAAITREMSERQAALQTSLVEHILAEKALLRDDQLPAFRRILEEHLLRPGAGEHGPLEERMPRARPE